MSINWERATHPDLLEEEAAAREQVEESASPEKPARGRRASRTARAEATVAADTAAAPPVAADAEGGGTDAVASPSEPSPDAPPESPQSGDANGAPEWLSQVKEATDPQTALSAILKNAPLEELQKDPRIAGWIGDMAQKRARALAQQQAQERAAQEKADAWQKGDYYRLGELSASEQEAQALLAQQQAASQPFMQSVTEFQKQLPEEVQLEIQGKQYQNVAEYLAATVEAATRHRRERELEAEIKKREPALRKAWLSETVGAEQSPERASGPTPGVREITDAEIDRMSLQEYDTYFDEHGRPKGGVRLRLTRGIDVTRR